MSDKKKLSNRIPYESLTNESDVSSWDLPSMDKKSRLVFSAKREKQDKRTQGKKNDTRPKESIEDYKSSVKPKPLTAEQLQALTKEAKKEGYDTGYQEGITSGLKEGTSRGLKEGEKKAYMETRAMLQDEISRLALISQQLFQPMEEQATALENTVVDMALHFAKELIEKEITQSPSDLVTIVGRALVALPAGAKNIAVYCNKKDAALVQKHCPKENRNWSIKVDDSISRGGCRVETLESLVDYTIDHRLKSFIQAVRDKGEIDSAQLPPVNDYSQESDKSLEDNRAGEVNAHKNVSEVDAKGPRTAENELNKDPENPPEEKRTAEKQSQLGSDPDDAIRKASSQRPNKIPDDDDPSRN